MTDEQLQQVELPGGKVERDVAPKGPAAHQVEVEITSGEKRLCGPLLAAQHGMDPCDQLLEDERLDQVVVGTKREAMHAVVDPSERGHHDHRHPAPVLAEPATDLEPVHPGEQEVEDHGVEAGPSQELERRFAVANHPDAESLFAEATAKDLGEAVVVLYHQDVRCRQGRDRYGRCGAVPGVVGRHQSRHCYRALAPLM